MHTHDIAACIFDFDGVIVDSEKYHHRAWQWLSKELGVPFDYEEYAPFKSAGRRVVIPYLFAKANKTLTDEEFEKYSRLREQHARIELSQITEKDILPGVVQFIDELKAQGIKCAVASASTSSNVVANKLGLYNLFDVFVDGQAQLKHKPDPEIFVHTADLLGVDRKRCVVFEDSINGIQAALNANIPVIGVRSYFTDLAPVIDGFENITLQRIEQLCTTKR